VNRKYQILTKEIEIMMIRGKFSRDNNFTHVYCDNTIYVIARNTGDWACVSVGDRTNMGGVLTQEVYDEWASKCVKEGTFVLS
jgi:hypothetical protein